MGIDYRELLKKYITVVVLSESVDYIDYDDDKILSDEEKNILHELAKDAHEEYYKRFEKTCEAILKMQK